MTNEELTALRDHLVAQAERLESEDRSFARGLRAAADQLSEHCQHPVVAKAAPVIAPPPPQEEPVEKPRTWKSTF